MGSVNLPAWLDSMGIDAENDYGVNESRLRAYAHTIANKTNTGVQEVTIFHANDYRIFGVFNRACNSIDVNQWGKWHEVVFVSEEGENADGKFIKRSDGVLECWSNDIEVDITSTSGAIYRDRKSTRLNSSHVATSYAVFCLKKKKGKLDQLHCLFQQWSQQLLCLL